MKTQIVNSFTEAFKCGPGLCIIDRGWPAFDANNRAYFTPDNPKYIEAERLPSAWLELVGKTVCADRTTVGTIADLLEELPLDVAEEWRRVYAASASAEGLKALDAFEEKHHICWYGEGYYIADDSGADSDEETAPFTLESATPSALTAEQERQRQREEITRRIARPIKGSGPVNVQPQFDIGQTGQMDLFSPIMEG